MTKRFNNPEIKWLRRKLRKNMTPAEVALWIMIKNKQLDNYRFLRQYSIGKYIVDFFCPEQKLAVELDGEVHFNDEQQKKDKRRSNFLNSLDIRVLRFENFEVFRYPERTLEEIRKYLNDKEQ